MFLFLVLFYTISPMTSLDFSIDWRRHNVQKTKFRFRSEEDRSHEGRRMLEFETDDIESSEYDSAVYPPFVPATTLIASGSLYDTHSNQTEEEIGPIHEVEEVGPIHAVEVGPIHTVEEVGPIHTVGEEVTTTTESSFVPTYY